jgi:hypothetical protein
LEAWADLVEGEMLQQLSNVVLPFMQHRRLPNPKPSRDPTQRILIHNLADIQILLVEDHIPMLLRLKAMQ